MMNEETRARLTASAQEYDRLADQAGAAGNLDVAADARQSAADIRDALRATDHRESSAFTYAELQAMVGMFHGSLLLLALQEGGKLVIRPETILRHGRDVHRGCYSVVRDTADDGAYTLRVTEEPVTPARMAGPALRLVTDEDGSVRASWAKAWALAIAFLGLIFGMAAGLVWVAQR